MRRSSNRQNLRFLTAVASFAATYFVNSEAIDSEPAMTKTAENDPETASFSKRDWLYWCFMLMGCGVTVPWNALLSAVDYFDAVYPDYNAVRWISVMYMPVFVSSLMISCFAPAKTRGSSRVSLGFLLSTITMSFISITDMALIRHGRGTDLTFAFLMISASLLAAAGGGTEGSIVGMAISLPLQYTQAHLAGNAVSGVAVVSLRALTKLSLPSTPRGLRTSACIFFFLSSALSLSSFLVYRFVIMRSHLFLSQSVTDEEQASAPLIAHSECEVSRTTLSEFIKVATKLRLAIVNMLIVATVTLTVFPGVASDVESDVLGDWYGVMLVAVFVIADFVVRLVPPEYVSTNPQLITVVNIARISMVPITLASVQAFSSPIWISLLVLFLAFSNGYLFMCGYAMGQERTHGKDECFIGGNILVASLILGLSLGSSFSLLCSKLI